MSAWITVIGMGEDGMQGLSSHCISMIQKAEVIFAGERHHCKVQNTQAEVLDWGKGI